MQCCAHSLAWDPLLQLRSLRCLQHAFLQRPFCPCYTPARFLITRNAISLLSCCEGCLSWLWINFWTRISFLNSMPKCVKRKAFNGIMTYINYVISTLTINDKKAFWYTSEHSTVLYLRASIHFLVQWEIEQYFHVNSKSMFCRNVFSTTDTTMCDW